MNDISRIGMDTSKGVFVLHGVDSAERVVLRKKLRRRQVLEFFAKLAPTGSAWRCVLERIIGPAGCGELVTRWG